MILSVVASIYLFIFRSVAPERTSPRCTPSCPRCAATLCTACVAPGRRRTGESDCSFITWAGDGQVCQTLFIHYMGRKQTGASDTVRHYLGSGETASLVSAEGPHKTPVESKCYQINFEVKLLLGLTNTFYLCFDWRFRKRGSTFTFRLKEL